MNFHDLMLRFGISASHAVPTEQVQHLFERLTPMPAGKLIRLGGAGDGGYWIPDDLVGLDYCFSPGVANSSSFEEALAQRGIKIFLAAGVLKGLQYNILMFHLCGAMWPPMPTSKKGLSAWINGMTG
jgi:hypothetical protein